jgi:threonine dehydratase
MDEGKVPSPTIADVMAAAGRIAGHAVRTPLLRSPALDERVGGRVFLKCESLQRTGSFKFRGACNALAALDPRIRQRGVVAVSSGNHGLAVAEAARLFGCPATIVMPADAPAVKRDNVLTAGATLVPYDRAVADREAVARGLIAANGGTLIHPFNDPLVIAGQGTAGLEIADDLAAIDVAPDAVAVPCGGGGLSAGIGLALRARFADIAVKLVEPRGFDDYGRSLASGRLERNAAPAGSVCDALLSPSPGAIGFSINRANRAEGLAVTDDEALAASAFAFRALRLVLEPGGAVALAALLYGKLPAADRVTVLVLSGGNIDPAMLSRALAIPDTGE